MLNAVSSILPGARRPPSPTASDCAGATPETNVTSTPYATPTAINSPRPLETAEADKMTQTDDLDPPAPCARQMEATALPRKSQTVISNHGQHSTTTTRSETTQTNGLPHSNTRRSDAAASHYLQRATARDLPSDPASGPIDPNAARAAAASLAHSSSKPIEPWKPNPNPAAGAAASMAHANQKSPDVVSRSTGGQSAALIANEGLSGSSKRYVLSDSAKRSSLTAALGATGTQSGWRRSESTPTKLRHDHGRNGHVPSSPSPEALTAVKETIRKCRLNSGGLPRENGINSGQRTDNTLANGRTDSEKRRSDVVRAASVSMAKSRSSDEMLPPAATEGRPRYPHLEEHARKIALERLARHGHDPTRRTRTRLFTSPDAISAGEISVKMNHSDGSTNSAREDQRKKGQDALLLMTVARRNVQTRLAEQDREIADLRGIVPREEWETVAQRIALRESEARLKNQENRQGKVDIGGGRFVDQAEIDRIAQRNVRPVLEDLNEKATEERKPKEHAEAREMGILLDRENERRAVSFLGRQEKSTEEELKKAKVLEKSQRKRFSLKSIAALPAAAIAPAFSHSNGRRINSTDDRRFSTSHHPEIRKVSVCPIPPDFRNSAPPSALAMNPTGRVSPMKPSPTDCRPSTSDGLPSSGTGIEPSIPPQRLLSQRRSTPPLTDDRGGLNSFGMVRSRIRKGPNPNAKDIGGTEEKTSRSGGFLTKLRRNILPSSKRDGTAAPLAADVEHRPGTSGAEGSTSHVTAGEGGERIIGFINTSSTDAHGVAHGRAQEVPDVVPPSGQSVSPLEDEEGPRPGMCLNKDTTESDEVLEEERLRKLREVITGSGVVVEKSRFTEDF